jgi:hypothetical protein
MLARTAPRHQKGRRPGVITGKLRSYCAPTPANRARFRKNPSYERKVVGRQPVKMHIFEYELVVVIESNDQVDDIAAGGAGGEISEK